MTKPLKDWTLGEVQEECKRRSESECGESCPLNKFCDGLSDDFAETHLPEIWDLTDTPTLTPDEMAVCRLLKASGVKKVEMCDGIAGAIFAGREMGLRPCRGLFPSLHPGDRLDLTTMDLEGAEQ